MRYALVIYLLIISSPLCAQFVIDTIPEVSVVGRNDLKQTLSIHLR
jgi:hypothetical protein